MKVLIAIGVLAIIGLIVISQSLYVVDETEQVIVTRFGDVRAVQREPGLYVKAPFVDTVTTYSSKVLLVDAPVERMLDRDLNILEIDVYSRYRIIDPVQFRRNLTTQESARDTLGARINAALRAEVASRNREQIVGGIPERDEFGNIVVDEEGNTRVIATESRTEILDEVLIAVREELAAEPEEFGIEILDVRVKRADFPGEVADRIFARMRTDRERISARLRAEGEEESQRIRAQADRERENILAQADRDSNILRGEGEAEAISILSGALGQDPEFFAFRRSLEAYRAFMSQQTTIVLSPDSELFRFLQDPVGNSAAGEETP